MTGAQRIKGPFLVLLLQLVLICSSQVSLIMFLSLPVFSIMSVDRCGRSAGKFFCKRACQTKSEFTCNYA